MLFRVLIHVNVCIMCNSLQIIHRFDVSVNALSVAISNNSQYLFLGRVDGRLLIIALDAKSVKAQIAASVQSGISHF